MCSPYLSSLSPHTVCHLSRNYGNQLVTMLGSIIACTNGYRPYQFNRAVVRSCCWSVITMLEGYQRWSFYICFSWPCRLNFFILFNVFYVILIALNIVLTPSMKPFLVCIFAHFWTLQRSADQVFLTGVCLIVSRIFFTITSTVTWEYCRNGPIWKTKSIQVSEKFPWFFGSDISETAGGVCPSFIYQYKILDYLYLDYRWSQITPLPLSGDLHCFTLFLNGGPFTW